MHQVILACARKYLICESLLLLIPAVDIARPLFASLSLKENTIICCRSRALSSHIISNQKTVLLWFPDCLQVNNQIVSGVAVLQCRD